MNVKKGTAVTERRPDQDVDSGEIVPVDGNTIDNGVRRALKSRHLQMIALGGVVGPGTFYATGYALQYSGPIGALIGYAIIGIDVFFVTQSLGEMATLFPSTGSFNEFAGRFVDPALSFALGWNYWSSLEMLSQNCNSSYATCLRHPRSKYALTEHQVTILANEYNGTALILQYWTTAIPNWGWILICWVFFTCTSLLGVLVYGEMEFWLASFKFFIIIALYLVAILIDTGGIGGDYIGFRYWVNPDPFVNGINGFGKVLVLAAVMYSGTEAVAITAGESRNPKRDLPKALRQTFWRIIIVYMGMIFFVGIICPSDSDELLNADSKTASAPFTIALERAGWAGAGNLINTIIVITVLSAINSSIYIGSRTLCAHAAVGRAPAFLGKTTSRGVPANAILFTSTCGLIALLNISSSAGTVFGYLLDISGAAAFIAWAFIGLTHLRMRKAMTAQGISTEVLPFRSVLFPYIPWALVIINIFLVFIQGYTTLLAPFAPVDFVFFYLVIPLFIIFYLGWKFWHKTKFIKPHEADLVSGRRDWLNSQGNHADNDIEDISFWKRARRTIVG
ncbi:MAG: General amino acid permease [Cirrosporium novae-zelandiae]|nr:MAG: General amino acid permease [Cirrosporium novae-zelandiae]